MVEVCLFRATIFSKSCCLISCVAAMRKEHFYGVVRFANDIFFTKEVSMEKTENCKGLTYAYEEMSRTYQVRGITDTAEETLQIPACHQGESVTGILPFAFQNNARLNDIILSENLLFIGEGAFNFCKNLRRISIPCGVVAVEKHTFYGCENLQTACLGQNVRKIEEGGFGMCAELEELVLPPSLLRIGKRAFDGCLSLRVVRLPQALKIIEEGAFYRCENLTEIRINAALSSIEKFAFADCEKLTNIIFEGSIAEWQAIEKGAGWRRGVPAQKIICKEGEAPL